MDSIRIDTGVKRIQINDGPEFISFNPSDILFMEKLTVLLGELQSKQEEMKAREAEFESVQELDANGIPVNAKARLAFMRETCQYMRAQIDDLFGEGTSQIVFGNTLNLDLFGQFFEGITPFIKVARAAKLEKYAPQHKTRVMR
jgi:hypothetical protein